MCVYTKDWFPKISRKPIKVYKILERNEIFGLVTPFIQQRVEIGKPIKAKIPWHRYDIHVDPYMIMYIIAAEGVHAYTKFAEARANITHSGNPQHIYEAIIPDWTFYWTDDYVKEIAAEEMIITKKLL